VSAEGEEAAAVVGCPAAERVEAAKAGRAAAAAAGEVAGVAMVGWASATQGGLEVVTTGSVVEERVVAAEEWTGQGDMMYI
jgi:hypothetical protein